MNPEQFLENLLIVLPFWHLTIDKTLKQALKGKMSLESYYCLQTLRQSGSLTMSELAERLKISRQQATQTVERLYEYEFVRRQFDPADRRRIKIEITEKAQTYIEQVYFQDAGFLESLTQRIGEENMCELAHAVGTLRQILPLLAETHRP